jgi:arsenate reductase
MKKVLFLCTQNACRSQMAEAICRHRLGSHVKTFSAGTAPAGVNPFAVRVLAEQGIDISDSRSKHIDEFQAESFDLVVTLCGGAAESCPVWPGQGRRIHVPFDDPAAVQGSDEEKLEAFRQVRDKMAEDLVPLVTRELGL